MILNMRGRLKCQTVVIIYTQKWNRFKTQTVRDFYLKKRASYPKCTISLI